MADKLLVHGTTVAIGDRAALLRGASGSGKSDLALRFIAGHGVWPDAGERRLVADDQTQLTVHDGALIATAPATIAGKMEVRGVGVVEVPALPTARLQLVVDLVGGQGVERLPDADQEIEILGCRVSHHQLVPFEASAPLKLAILLRQATERRR